MTKAKEFLARAFFPLPLLLVLETAIFRLCLMRRCASFAAIMETESEKAVTVDVERQKHQRESPKAEHRRLDDQIAADTQPSQAQQFCQFLTKPIRHP